MSLVPSVDQSAASAGGDNVGNNKTTIGVMNLTMPALASAGVIETLMSRLADEIRNDEQTQSTVDGLAFYFLKKSTDGVDGLEAKLSKAGRDEEFEYAIALKEMFVKLLYRYSLYSSAQEIFAYVLSRAHNRYRTLVTPQISTLGKVEINVVINSQIVEPIVAEVGAGVFVMNDNIVMGMIYWLAEQCYIRWHA